MMIIIAIFTFQRASTEQLSEDLRVETQSLELLLDPLDALLELLV